MILLRVLLVGTEALTAGVAYAADRNRLGLPDPASDDVSGVLPSLPKSEEVSR
jgi:hypothetical protein